MKKIACFPPTPNHEMSLLRDFGASIIYFNFGSIEWEVPDDRTSSSKMFLRNRIQNRIGSKMRVIKGSMMPAKP